MCTEVDSHIPLESKLSRAMSYVTVIILAQESYQTEISKSYL